MEMSLLTVLCSRVFHLALHSYQSARWQLGWSVNSTGLETSPGHWWSKFLGVYLVMEGSPWGPLLLPPPFSVALFPALFPALQQLFAMPVLSATVSASEAANHVLDPKYGPF